MHYKSDFLNILKSQFKLNIKAEHGISHWRRVALIGNYLARHTGADIEVVNFFAYLHDSKRENELYDPEHGLRASAFAKELYDKKLIKINAQKLEVLQFACEHHSDSKVKSDDITVQTCWDADRLDLWRVGIEPKREFLNTDFAQNHEAMKFAKNLLTSGIC